MTYPKSLSDIQKTYPKAVSDIKNLPYQYDYMIVRNTKCFSSQYFGYPKSSHRLKVMWSFNYLLLYLSILADYNTSGEGTPFIFNKDRKGCYHKLLKSKLCNKDSFGVTEKTRQGWCPSPLR